MPLREAASRAPEGAPQIGARRQSLLLARRHRSEEIDPIVCHPKAGDSGEISVKRNHEGRQILGWILRIRMGITVVVLQPPERDDCPAQRAPEMIDVEVIHVAREQPESVYLPKYDRVRTTRGSTFSPRETHRHRARASDVGTDDWGCQV